MNSTPPQSAESNVTIKPPRLYYLDWLRILAIYELLVRRINVLRFLFGMRLKKKTKVA